ncbi:MAG: type II toxin-antitoxin system Phd/YefM family antitoxin [Cardiobacterium sp.]|uniref:type II toxin-antitoxin system Phd/YefM family antitoxin n=1 Tax=uncultured Cardiobacterium sp. TaxID=417619 RepID=UPI002630EBA9|nr:type II toxin-antitoxin system prevent-host-death family antitoxin [uncultured Cardiobacterium sp.]
MQTISFSDACDNLKNVLDRVAHDKSTTRITRRNGEDAVVMSLDTYNSLMETLHLLKTPANAAHLQRSITQYHSGAAHTKELTDE